MKELILYFSLAGATKKYAEERAEKDGAEIREIKEIPNRNGFTAWIPGVFQAAGNKKTTIESIGDFDSYDKIILAGPIWAGNAVPALNSAAAILPQGSKVELVLVSGSGKDYSAKLAEAIKANGSEVIDVINIKSGK